MSDGGLLIGDGVAAGIVRIGDTVRRPLRPFSLTAQAYLAHLRDAAHLIDMGPGGGPDGGQIIAAGTPEDVARDPGSVTGPWLAGYWACRRRASSVSRRQRRANHHDPVMASHLAGNEPGPVVNIRTAKREDYQ